MYYLTFKNHIYLSSTTLLTFNAIPWPHESTSKADLQPEISIFKGKIISIRDDPIRSDRLEPNSIFSPYVMTFNTNVQIKYNVEVISVSSSSEMTPVVNLHLLN